MQSNVDIQEKGENYPVVMWQTELMLGNVSMLPRATFNAITLQRRPLPRSVTSHSEPQFFGHFRAQRLSVGLCVFLGIPTELHDCDENRER